MIKLKYWLIGMLVLATVGVVVFVGFALQKKSNNNEENKKEHIKIVNTGVKLVPTFEKASRELRSHYMYSETMDIATEQKWNKDTKLKYCIRYKSNTDSSNYRGAILYANSPLVNGYIFQINILEYKTDYYCDSWAWAKGGGTYSIDIPSKTSFLNKDIFHEICVDDINSQLNHCASKWGISENDAYLTNIYQGSISSPTDNLNSYTIFDYFKIFIDGNQTTELLFLNQDFNKFLGLADDNKFDDFVGWKEYKNSYAVSIQE